MIKKIVIGAVGVFIITVISFYFLERRTAPSALSSTSTSTSVSKSTSTPILPVQGKIKGKVILGPTCPVERIPPDPQCAPRPYQATIFIYKTTDTAKPYKTLSTTASGTFMAALDPGTYILNVQRKGFYPRCQNAQVEVLPNKVKKVTVSCDTGIR
jgi:hypothetical protein